MYIGTKSKNYINNLKLVFFFYKLTFSLSISFYSKKFLVYNYIIKDNPLSMLLEFLTLK